MSMRMAAVQAPVIPIVGELIRTTPGTISLGQGLVSYAPPPQAMARVRAWPTDPSEHKYGPVEGERALVEALAAKLRAENGLDLSASRIVVTAGGNMAFMNAVLAIADPGDEIVLVAPYYFNHEMAVVMAGCRPVVVSADRCYQLDPGAIAAAITPRTRAVVTISPNNPTGAVYPEPAIAAVNALCAGRGLLHIHDEAYEYFLYGGARHFSPGSLPGAAAHTISLFSLSKAYGLASWRMGYMVVPERLFVDVNKIQDTILICPPLVSQAAALGALEAGRAYCEPHVARLAQIRTLVLERLAALEDLVEAPTPDGAFYCLLRLATTLPDMVVVERLVREHRVAVIPGSAFGAADGCYLRISYGALEESTVAEGMDRLARGLRAVVGPGERLPIPRS
jgi:aspartate/methionine/tyrosine aminotransferase